MDRVIQEYEGMMYMDFSQEGGYERLDPSLCPPLVLVISDRPSESGSVHSNVKKRWEQGDPQAKHLISSIADLAREGKAHLANGDATQLASLMDRNFDSRRELFGDSALGEKTVQMIELAHQVGASAKLPGDLPLAPPSSCCSPQLFPLLLDARLGWKRNLLVPERGGAGEATSLRVRATRLPSIARPGPRAPKSPMKMPLLPSLFVSLGKVRSRFNSRSFGSRVACTEFGRQLTSQPSQPLPGPVSCLGGRLSAMAPSKEPGPVEGAFERVLRTDSSKVGRKNH